jgi:hypothetical protein
LLHCTIAILGQEDLLSRTFDATQQSKTSWLRTARARRARLEQKIVARQAERNMGKQLR